MSEITKFGILD